MEKVLEFLKDLLTDKMDPLEVKSKALELYVMLKTPKEAVWPEPEKSMVFNLIHSNDINSRHTIHIKPNDFLTIRELVLTGKKIQAIKHMRQHGLINGDISQICPGLRECKEVLEGYRFV